MRKEYCTTEEDEKFSQTVIRFNNTTDEKERAKIQEEIRRRTKIIIYRMSRDNLHLSPDEASNIFLEMNDELDRIISQYKVSGATFNQYIRQLCIYRSRRLRRNHSDKAIWENQFLMEEGALVMGDSYEYDCIFDDNERYGAPSYDALMKYRDYSFKELYEHIVKDKSRPDHPLYNKYERKLREALDNKTARKRFLVFMLTMPIEVHSPDSLDIARVLKADESAIVKLMELKSVRVGYKIEKENEIMARANMHWRIMARLKTNLAVEHDEKKRKSLMDHYQTHVRCHRDRMMEVRKLERGMTRSEIAQALNISRSSITDAMRSTSNLLEKIMKE